MEYGAKGSLSAPLVEHDSESDVYVVLDDELAEGAPKRPQMSYLMWGVGGVVSPPSLIAAAAP